MSGSYRKQRAKIRALKANVAALEAEVQSLKASLRGAQQRAADQDGKLAAIRSVLNGEAVVYNITFVPPEGRSMNIIGTTFKTFDHEAHQPGNYRPTWWHAPVSKAGWL